MQVRMKIRPIGDKLLLRVPEEQEKVVGGIVVTPGKLRDGGREAFVEAPPNDYAGSLNVGDRVLMPPYAGTEIRINKVLMVFVKEEALLVAFE